MCQHPHFRKSNFCSQKCSDKNWYLNNKEKCRRQKKVWYNNNKQKEREYYQNNKERRCKYLKQWRHRNKDHLSLRAKQRYHQDVEFRIASTLRSRLNQAIKNNQKSGSAVKNLGCSIADFKVYIESKWQEGMVWDNWTKDGWHIDHIKPLCQFDLTNPEELKKACHYTNLKPMWAKENLSKGSRYE